MAMLQLSVMLDDEAVRVPIQDDTLRVDWSVVASRVDAAHAHLTVSTISRSPSVQAVHQCLLENLPLQFGQKLRFELEAPQVDLQADPLSGLKALACRPMQRRTPRYLTPEVAADFYKTATQKEAATERNGLFATRELAGLAISSEQGPPVEIRASGQVWAVHCSGSWSRNYRPEQVRVHMATFPTMGVKQQAASRWIDMNQPLDVVVSL